LFRFHLGVAAVCLLLSAVTVIAAPNDGARVEQLVRERLTASARSDKATWRKHIADDCLWVGPGLLVGSTADAESEQIGTSEVRTFKDFQTRAFGDVVIATYLMIARGEQNGAATHRRWRKSDTFRRVGQDWKMIQAVEIIVPMREIAKIDPKVLNDYVGTYRLKADVELKVWREGDKLMMQATAQAPGETLPAGNDVFFDDGEPGEYRFVRDGSRKVIAVVYSNEGVELRLDRVS
jgi:ketosteroid isomerase-like protein